jgi:hypothetical protein
MLAETWIPTITQDCTGTNNAQGVTYELLTDTFTVQKNYSGFCMQQCRSGGLGGLSVEGLYETQNSNNNTTLCSKSNFASLFSSGQIDERPCKPDNGSLQQQGCIVLHECHEPKSHELDTRLDLRFFQILSHRLDCLSTQG